MMPAWIATLIRWRNTKQRDGSFPPPTNSGRWRDRLPKSVCPHRVPEIRLALIAAKAVHLDLAFHFVTHHFAVITIRGFLAAPTPPSLDFERDSAVFELAPVNVAVPAPTTELARQLISLLFQCQSRLTGTVAAEIQRYRPSSIQCAHPFRHPVVALLFAVRLGHDLTRDSIAAQPPAVMRNHFLVLTFADD